MAPSASMLFLSYHQLHHGPAAAEAVADAPREGGAGAGAFRLGFRNVLFSTGFLAPTRRDAAPEVAGGEGNQRGLRAGGDHTERAAEELDSKFEEAVRLSCWSS